MVCGRHRVKKSKGFRARCRRWRGHAGRGESDSRSLLSSSLPFVRLRGLKRNPDRLQTICPQPRQVFLWACENRFASRLCLSWSCGGWGRGVRTGFLITTKDTKDTKGQRRKKRPVAAVVGVRPAAGGVWGRYRHRGRNRGRNRNRYRNRSESIETSAWFRHGPSGHDNAPRISAHPLSVGRAGVRCAWSPSAPRRHSHRCRCVRLV